MGNWELGTGKRGQRFPVPISSFRAVDQSDIAGVIQETHLQPCSAMKLILATGALVLAASSAGAQVAAKPAPKHAPTCARAIKTYDDIKQIPVPHDTVEIPAPDGPIRVTNEAEAEAADLALRTRAGTVGATGMLVTTIEQDNGSGMITMRRNVTGIYVRADSAEAQKTCAAKPGLG